MFPKKERVRSLLKAVLEEMDLLATMGKDIHVPDDFGLTTSGMIIFRACGMSLQYITESFVKIRNLCGKDYFKKYSSVPWDDVFGMRNFLSHDYGEVDMEGIFNTVKIDMPILKEAAVAMQSDLVSGKMDEFFSDK